MSTILRPNTDRPFPNFLTGGGQMGEAIRRYDWTHSPLGEFGTWPGALQTVVGIMLHSQTAMCIVWGPDMTLLYNDRYHSILAGKATDPCAFLGKPFRAVWPEVWEEVGPMLASTMRGVSVSYEDKRFMLMRNGMLEEVFVSFSTSPVFDADGTIGGVLCICNETSNRVRTRLQRDAAVEELERSVLERRRVEQRLRLLDTIGEATRLAGEPEAIMEHSTRLLGEFMGVTRVAYADMEADNDRFNIRYDWHVDGVGSTVGTYSLNLFGAEIARSLRAGHTTYFDDVDALPPGDGREMFIQIGTGASICCPLVKQGRLVALMAVHQAQARTWTPDEIALVEAVVERCWAHIERVKSHEALREADRRKSEFLATLAHELRNPLAPIRSSLEVLRMGGDRPGMLDKVRGIMERQVTHMTHLINDLLDIARISSGKVVLKVERVSLQSIVDSAVEASQHLIDSAEHRFVVDVPDDPVWIDGDPVRLTQILVNLLSNAAKYTARRGNIELAVAVSSDHVAVRVSDNGIGIAPESLESVFEMFSQAHPSAAMSKGGLGIGLSLVRHLVTLHGGTVTASSAGVNFGSSFTVQLPLADAAASEGGAPQVEQASTVASPGAMRILLADDNVDAAETLARLLQLQGHIVTVAHDGEQAVRLAVGGSYDVVVLDIGMPVMDGYQAAQALRSMPRTSATCLVALTGWGAEEDRARTRAAGFDHHLLKPAQLSEIQNILAQKLPDLATQRVRRPGEQ